MTEFALSRSDMFSRGESKFVEGSPHFGKLFVSGSKQEVTKVVFFRKNGGKNIEMSPF